MRRVGGTVPAGRPLTTRQRVGLAAAPPALDALVRSLRFSLDAPSPTHALLTSGAPCVVAFWHAGMLASWFAFRRPRAAALVSASADGEILARLLARWGVAVVRGSSSRGGPEALAAAVELLRSGARVLMTPDGPRGPRGVMKIGAIVAAQRAGVPLVLAAAAVRPAMRLRSWDRFVLPLPLARCRIRCSAPIAIDPALAGAPLDELRLQIERELHALAE